MILFLITWLLSGLLAGIYLTIFVNKEDITLTNLVTLLIATIFGYVMLGIVLIMLIKEKGDKIVIVKKDRILKLLKRKNKEVK
jgi:LytS/YehU family sensor histidine kinase